MTLKLEVKTGQPWMGFWSAVLWVDGVETTFSCNHNHKTEGAARKCSANVLAQARKFTWHPTFQERVIDTSGRDMEASLWDLEPGTELVEWSRQGVTARFRRAK
jgi:hypothetical protein